MLSKEKIRQIIATAINEDCPSFMFSEGFEPKDGATDEVSIQNDIEEGINKISEAYYRSQESEG